MDISESIAATDKKMDALYTALAAAQAEADNAIKGSVNPHLKNRYADLGSVLDSAKPVLQRHGLAIITLPGQGDADHAGFTTTIVHSGGGCITQNVRIPYGAKKDAQAYGGALTYARRYALSAWLNMWSEDDDGEVAVGRKPQAAPAGNSPVATVAKSPSGKTAKQLIDVLANVGTSHELDALGGEVAAFKGTADWASIEAVGKAARARVNK